MNKIKIFIQVIKYLWKLGQTRKDLEAEIGALKGEMHRLRNETNAMQNKYSEIFEANVDLHHKGPSTIVVMGRMKSQDYFKIYQINDRDLIDIVDGLKRYEQSPRLNVVDGLPSTRRVLRDMYKSF